MKNERGFATIFALCFILVVALIVKGIQETETNHTHEATYFQIEFQLQNMADGGIYEAAEIVRVNKASDEEPLLSDKKNSVVVSRTKNFSHGKIQLTVWGRIKQIQLFDINYSTYKITPHSPVVTNDGYALLSVATFTDEAGNKKYRRAFAYVLDDDATTIHFLELPSVTK